LEALPGSVVWVGNEDVEVDDKEMPLNSDMQSKIDRFDAGLGMSPFSFELDFEAINR
jgi:hypothetical protein